AKGKPIALLFEFDGDVNATKHGMCNWSASLPTLASKIKTSSVEANTNKMKIVASPIVLVHGGRPMVKKKTTAQSTQA
ncbi:phage tail protein, partial [Bacillus thuringiensis]|nr:phage tail protein [Bacillus thuringiensis]